MLKLKAVCAITGFLKHLVIQYIYIYTSFGTRPYEGYAEAIYPVNFVVL